MKTKARSFCVYICILGYFLGFWGCASYQNKEYQIRYDEKKLQYREAFLAENTVETKQAKQTKQERKPNIIVILADDLGKMDLRLYNKLYKQSGGLATPNIERIARDGVVFKDAYVTSAVCAPSRAALLTGRYHQRYGYEFMNMERYPKDSFQENFIRKFIDTGIFTLAEVPADGVPNKTAVLQQGLPLTEITLASLLKKNNYRTGIIGKWHLSDYRNNNLSPRNRGFHYHYGFYGSHSLYNHKERTKDVVNVKVPNEFSDPHIWRSKRRKNSRIFRNGKKIKEKGYLTYKIADEAVSFIERNKDNPFFLYVPFNAPHTPLQAPKDIFKKYKDNNNNNSADNRFKQVYAAMIEALDTAVGDILDSLERNKLDENTLIFFLSDNGGALYTRTTDNGILRAGKLTQFNGGLSIPFIMQWKSKLPGNRIYKASVSSLDIFKTAANAAHAALPSDREYDGIDLIEHVAENKTPKRSLFFRVFKNKAVIDGPWKLIVNDWDNTKNLYNIESDVSESRDVKDENTAIYENLLLKLKKFEEDVPFAPLWPRVMDALYKEDDYTYRFSF